jgi:hypothetical protein
VQAPESEQLRELHGTQMQCTRLKTEAACWARVCSCLALHLWLCWEHDALIHHHPVAHLSPEAEDQFPRWFESAITKLWHAVTGVKISHNAGCCKNFCPFQGQRMLKR